MASINSIPEALNYQSESRTSIKEEVNKYTEISN